MNNMKKAGEGIDQYTPKGRGYWKSVAEWAMEYVKKNCSSMDQYLDYCVLNNIFCDKKLECSNWEIYKGARGGFHFCFKDGKYADPDKVVYAGILQFVKKNKRK